MKYRYEKWVWKLVWGMGIVMGMKWAWMAAMGMLGEKASEGKRLCGMVSIYMGVNMRVMRCRRWAWKRGMNWTLVSMLVGMKIRDGISWMGSGREWSCMGWLIIWVRVSMGIWKGKDSGPSWGSMQERRLDEEWMEGIWEWWRMLDSSKREWRMGMTGTKGKKMVKRSEFDESRDGYDKWWKKWVSGGVSETHGDIMST